MDGRTHHDECWRDHHDCAVAKVERLREKLKHLAWYYAGTQDEAAGTPARRVLKELEEGE